MAHRSQTGVVVQHANDAGSLQVAACDVGQLAVGPAQALTAIKNAIRVRVLAAGDGRGGCGLAHTRHVRQQLLLHLPECRRGKRLGQDQGVHFFVARVAG